MQISFKRTTPRQMAAAGRLSGLLIQAFKTYFPQVDRRIWTQLGARVERAY